MQYAFVSNAVFFLLLSGAFLLGWLALAPFMVFLFVLTSVVAAFAFKQLQALEEQKLWLKKQTYKKKSATEVLIPPKGLKTFLYALEHKTYTTQQDLLQLYSGKPYVVFTVFMALAGLVALMGGAGFVVLQSAAVQTALKGQVLLAFLLRFFAAPSGFSVLFFTVLSIAAICFSAIAIRKAWRRNFPLLNNVLPKKDHLPEEALPQAKNRYKAIFTVYVGALLFSGALGVYAHYKQEKARENALYQASALAQAQKDAEVITLNKKLSFLEEEKTLLEKNFEETLNKNKELKELLDSLEKTIDQKTASFSSAERIATSLQIEIEKLKAALKTTQQEKETLQKKVSEQTTKLNSVSTQAQKFEVGSQEVATQLKNTQEQLAQLKEQHQNLTAQLNTFKEQTTPLLLHEAALGPLPEEVVLQADTLIIGVDNFFNPQTPDVLLENLPLQEELTQIVQKTLKENPGYNALFSVHGDGLPPQTGLYPTSEELTSAQASKLAAMAGKAGFAERLYAIGLGSKQKLNDKLTEEALQANRRVEITFFKGTPCFTKACISQIGQ